MRQLYQQIEILEATLIIKTFIFWSTVIMRLLK